MVQWLKNIFARLMQDDLSPSLATSDIAVRSRHTFALSCAVGVYISLSPFIGFHTIMVFLFSWLFALNFSVILAVSVMINNPWTMMPLYGVSHVVGDRTLSWMGFNHYSWNPSWISKGNALVAHYVGFSGFSFWAFMFGGNLLGIGCALIAYPIIRVVSGMMLRNKPKDKKEHADRSPE